MYSYYSASPKAMQQYREQTDRCVSGPPVMTIRKTCGNGCGQCSMAGGRVINGQFYCCSCAESGRLPESLTKKKPASRG